MSVSSPSFLTELEGTRHTQTTVGGGRVRESHNDSKDSRSRRSRWSTPWNPGTLKSPTPIPYSSTEQNPIYVSPETFRPPGTRDSPTIFNL